MAENSQKQPKQQIVKMDNALVRARHGLSLSEKRLIALSITKSFPKTLDKGVDITAKEFAEAYDIHPQTAYRELKAASDELFERMIHFHGKDAKGRFEIKMRWVGVSAYREDEGYVHICFTPQVAPLLFNLKAKFTQYSLESTKGLRSHYSWRLMEMLERFRNAPQDKDGFNFWQSTVEELHLTFEAPASCQKHFGAFKQKIINTSVKEVNEKTAWNVKWEPIKTGRKITSIKFLFKLDEQLKLGLDG